MTYGRAFRFVIARAIIGGRTLVNYSKLGLEVSPGKRFKLRATGRSRTGGSSLGVKTPIGR